MAGNVLSVDSASDLIYLHTGFTSTISDSFSSPTDSPTGLGWDSTNVLSTDTTSDFIYKHTGFSSTISDSFSSPSSTPRGGHWDGTNVLSTDTGSDLIYLHTGFTSTINDSFSSPSTIPTDVNWDGTNVLSVDQSAAKIYLHTGFSSTISDSFSSPSNAPQAVGWDGTSVLSVEANTPKIYLHTGFSSTISDSFSSPSTTPRGVANDAWDGVVATAALTGTVTASITESDIVAGGKTIILTLSHDTWVPDDGTFAAQRDEIIAGIDSAQSELLGWDNVVKALQGVAGVVRTSATVVTITLDAQATYNITAQETITATIPATALTRGIAIVASPSFTIDPDGAPPPPSGIVGWKTLLGVGQG